jgi:dienelactone hydrolase
MPGLQSIETTAEEVLPYEDSTQKYSGVFVPRPSGTPVRAGVLIVPDWRGLSPFFRQQAQLLSRAGYDVTLADLYGDGRYAEHATRLIARRRPSPLHQGISKYASLAYHLQ